MLLIPLLFAEMPSLFFFFFIYSLTVYSGMDMGSLISMLQCCKPLPGENQPPNQANRKKKKCPFQSSVNTTVCLNWSDQCAEI